MAVMSNVISFSTAASACGKGRRWKQAMTVALSGMTPNVISFSAAISACEKGGQWESIDDF